MKDLIKNIIEGNNIDETFNYVLDNLYIKGPVSTTDMEILSYLNIYHSEKFAIHKDAILNYMALFYKSTDRNTLKDAVFGQYRKYIIEELHKEYTPIQASIVKGITNNKCFSFSAPTSTGKSYVFMNEILKCNNDVVIVVPSRALINEYYLKLCNLIEDKAINILTFIDKINTRFSKRSIFVVTPERCRELFKQRNDFNVGLFLFDEAQLSDEESKRGLFFDSIVRRCQKAYPEATYVFAHPFIKNPEAQIQKNHFRSKDSFSKQYIQKNVGQMFLCNNKNWEFFHFGIDSEIMGRTKERCHFDPIEKAIKSGGSVLFYVSKAKIYNKEVLSKFNKYISLCPTINDDRVDSYIEKIKSYTGGDTISNRSHYSLMIDLLKRGIVIHHGSLPLETRILMEQFTKDKLCKICFATSTLEQGINMPFDVVYLDRLEKSKPLSVKNLIGRAGRSTIESKFDFGCVIINSAANIANLRSVIIQDEELSFVSALEIDEQQDDDYNEFKKAILEGTFSDEYNLTEKEIIKLSSQDVDKIIENIIKSMFNNNDLLPFSTINEDLEFKLSLYFFFQQLYSVYLGRLMNGGEADVLNTAIKIILWKVYGQTFKNICWYRYSYVTKSHLQSELIKCGLTTNHLTVAYLTGYHEIPNKDLKRYPLFKQGVKAKNVDYDLIMYDTYDYIDKLIGFKLSDIFYAAFYKYYERKQDTRSLRLAKYVKYGTDNERHIWMLRYGLSFEDIDILEKHIEKINTEGIIFKESINELSEDEKAPVLRFIH